MFDSDKDLDEIELQVTRLIDPHSYVNQPGISHERPYSNA